MTEIELKYNTIDSKTKCQQMMKSIKDTIVLVFGRNKIIHPSDITEESCMHKYMLYQHASVLMITAFFLDKYFIIVQRRNYV